MRCAPRPGSARASPRSSQRARPSSPPRSSASIRQSVAGVSPPAARDEAQASATLALGMSSEPAPAPSSASPASPEGTWHALVPLAELAEDDTGRTLEVAGRRIALFRAGDCVHALDDACPHQGASLGDGVVREGQVTCPWHSFHFDLRDGRNADGLPLAVGVHATRVRPDGVVELRLGERD